MFNLSTFIHYPAVILSTKILCHHTDTGFSRRIVHLAIKFLGTLQCGDWYACLAKPLLLS